MSSQVQLIGGEFSPAQQRAALRAAKRVLHFNQADAALAYRASCDRADGRPYRADLASAWDKAERKAIEAARAARGNPGATGVYGGILVYREVRVSVTAGTRAAA